MALIRLATSGSVMSANDSIKGVSLTFLEESSGELDREGK